MLLFLERGITRVLTGRCEDAVSEDDEVSL